MEEDDKKRKFASESNLDEAHKKRKF